jgi:O-antigen/teichoic acid export membrane protein
VTAVVRGSLPATDLVVEDPVEPGPDADDRSGSRPCAPSSAVADVLATSATQVKAEARQSARALHDAVVWSDRRARSIYRGKKAPMTVTTVPKTDDLKQKVVQGGTAKLVGQAANFVLRLAFLTIMARLLSPEEFGLVAMVTVVTGFYGLFTSAGLSSATVQRGTVTDAQMSTLFWVNMLIGALLSALCLATAPALVALFHEPRLTWVTAAMAAGFLVNAAGVQHIALLQRDLRFVTLTSIEVLAQVASMATGIALAAAGFGYWALVAAALAGPGVLTVLSWTTTGWIPGRPHRDAEIMSMLRFGGLITIQSALNYGAQNIDTVLVGRFRGAKTVGIYGRAYQLVAMPMANLSAALGWVAFSALSRIQDDPQRYRSYFLKGYSVVVSLIVPILVFAAVFADDTIRVLLGAQWTDVSLIVQLLAPAGIVVALTEPPNFWVLHSLGMVGRSLRVTCALAVVIVVACTAGIPHGATGVATALSIVMSLWLVPCLAWCVHGTPVRLGDVLRTAWGPLLGSVVASAVAFVAVNHFSQPLVRLLLGGVLMCCGYFAIMWFIFRQRDFYRGLVKDLGLISRGR